jgi:SAM-dependent methyltransferase
VVVQALSGATPHELAAPSPWVVRWAPLIPAGGAVLDLACGYGRHARYLAGAGYRVTAVDRDPAPLATLAGFAGVRTVEADLEGAPWPFAAGAFAGIVVVNYLHRPLFDALAVALAPGGVLIYETFMAGNEAYGRPSNPDFLLRPYELADAWRGRLGVVAFEQGRVARPKPAVVQRVCALCLPPAAAPLG